MASSVQPSVHKEATSSLKVNNGGWKIQLFEDQNKISTCVCTECKSVCCDAVELGCDHNDEDIFLFCNDCLNNLVNANDNKCPINGHEDPTIVPTRASRRQISKATVFCPYSTAYKTSNNEVVNNDYSHIEDTLSVYEEEGAPKQIQNECKVELNQRACIWKGSLHKLVNDHIAKCIQNNDPLYSLNIKIKDLEHANNELKQENVSLKIENEELKQQLNDKENNMNNVLNEIQQQKTLIQQMQNKAESLQQENDRHKLTQDENVDPPDDYAFAVQLSELQQEEEDMKIAMQLQDVIDNHDDEFTFSVESREQKHFQHIQSESVTYKGSIFSAMRGSRCLFGPWLISEESFTAYFVIPKISDSLRSSCYGFGFITAESKRNQTDSTHAMFITGNGHIYIYDEFLDFNDYKNQQHIEHMSNLIETPSDGIIATDSTVVLSINMKNRKASIWNDNIKQNQFTFVLPEAVRIVIDFMGNDSKTITCKHIDNSY